MTWMASIRGRPKAGLLFLLFGPFPGVSAAQGSAGTGALEVRIAPGDFLCANVARHVGLGYEGVAPYRDLVLQAVYFVNAGDEPLTIEAASIELLADGVVLQSTEIPVAEIARASAMAEGIAQGDFPVALDVYYAASRMFPDGVVFSPTLTLAPGSAAVVDDSYLIVRALPDEARVNAWARTAAGEEVVATGTLPVRTCETRNHYILPVEAGEWYLQAYPGLEGHHRWAAATEHAYDITKVDARGSWAEGEIDDWCTGRVPDWEGWYAYGAQVLAAAAGTVVKVVDDVEFPLEFWNRHEGESLDAYHARIGQRQMELFQAPGADPAAVAGGNHVVLEHPGGEFSFYAHLAHGSIRVKPGEQVTQGQPIAAVGGTGEAPAVHLHFQVTDGPSLIGARTLPVRFTNVQVNQPSAEDFAPEVVFQPGFFVRVLPVRR